LYLLYSIINVSIIPTMKYSETYDLKLPAHFMYIYSIWY